MASGYIPPYKRNEPAAVTKAVSMASMKDFPDLSLNVKKTVAWGASKTSFSQKVKDLIANEQKSEVEREAEREAARAIYGYVILDIRPFTKEKYILFNERMLGIETADNFQITTAERFQTIVEEKQIIEINETILPVLVAQSNFNNDSLVELESKTSEEHESYVEDDYESSSESLSESYVENTYDEYY